MPACQCYQQNIVAKWKKEKRGICYAKKEETEKAESSKKAKERMRPGSDKKKIEVKHSRLESGRDRGVQEQPQKLKKREEIPFTFFAFFAALLRPTIPCLLQNTTKSG